MLQARDIAGAPAAAAGVTARLLEAAEAEAVLPGLRSHSQPALLLQGGAVVDVRAYLRYTAAKRHALKGVRLQCVARQPGRQPASLLQSYLAVR